MVRFVPLLLLAAATALLPHDSAAAPAVPTPLTPEEGVRIGGYNPTLAWTVPEGATQVHLRVTPFNDDGPGIDLIRNASGSLAIPGLPDCACLLPDMTYTWEVRASDAPAAVALDDPSWSPPSVSHFRTPLASSAGIVPREPLPGAAVPVATPTLRWDDSDVNIFYYELQVSTDPAFGDSGPIAPVHSSVFLTLPAGASHSYTLPEAAALGVGKTYFWRVRPRIQGDGSPVAWSPVWAFEYPLQCCTATAWIERNSFAQEHQSYRAFGKLTDAAGRPLVGAMMQAVWTQLGQRTDCFGGYTDALGTASCLPPQAPVPAFTAQVPVTVEVKLTYQNTVYTAITSFTPLRSWTP